MDSDDEYSSAGDVSEGTYLMPPRRFLKLTQYLDLLRDAAFTRADLWMGTPPSLTMVMGNSSADLDSIVSATLLAYFRNSGGRGGSPTYGVRRSFAKEDPSRRLYLSLINMPTTDSQKELQRLRSEFGVALREALKAGSDQRDIKDANEDPMEMEQLLCKSMLTVFDMTKYGNSFQNFKPLFKDAGRDGKDKSPNLKQEVILVDHNAPSIPGLSADHISKNFRVVGCIDHHVDDGYVDKSVKPRVILTGIGSCTSLVVKYLRVAGLWPDISKHRLDAKTKTYTDNSKASDLDEKDILALRQMSVLALAPILIDTSNLRASGEKCSDTDREAVTFLESQLDTSKALSAKYTYDTLDRNKLYGALSEAKVNSLNNLTLPEIFDRDYKQWNDDVVIGISSIVKPISWLLENLSKSQTSTFVQEMEKFSISAERKLGVFVFSTRGVKDKAKELCAVAFTQDGVRAIEAFEKKATNDLGLEQWDGDDSLQDEMQQKFKQGSWRLWWMKEVTKTRKQIAPLMRDAVKSIAST